MRTTITLPDDLVDETRKVTGISSVSEAIAQGLREYLDTRKRAELLNHLFDNPVPHKMSKIKKERRK